MHSQKMSYDEFSRYISVPRETFSKLEIYVQLLEKWQKTINLISAATVKSIWIRHIIDSIQLVSHISADDVIVDLGSGAGFPGLVIAMMGNTNITLVESDNRKAAFLREAARMTETHVNILCDRVEKMDLKNFSLITARGFAPLITLLQILENTLKASHKLLLLKGKNYMSEITAAQSQWAFDYQLLPSIADSEGVILSMHNFIKRI